MCQYVYVRVIFFHSFAIHCDLAFEKLLTECHHKQTIFNLFNVTHSTLSAGTYSGFHNRLSALSFFFTVCYIVAVVVVAFIYFSSVVKFFPSRRKKKDLFGNSFVSSFLVHVFCCCCSYSFWSTINGSLAMLKSNVVLGMRIHTME